MLLRLLSPNTVILPASHLCKKVTRTRSTTFRHECVSAGGIRPANCEGLTQQLLQESRQGSRSISRLGRMLQKEERIDPSSWYCALLS